jgi:hypothetical protein
MNKFLGPILCLAVLVMLTGCATGGGSSDSSGGRSRGNLSDAVAQSAQKDDSQGRGNGRTRSRNEASTSDSDEENSSKDDDNSWNDDDYQDYANDDDSDGGGSWLSGLTWGLFSGGDDDGDSPEAGAEAGEDAEITRNNLNLWYSKSHLAGDTIQGFSTYSLMYSGFRGPKFRGHLGVYYGRATLGNQDNIQEGIRRISDFGVLTGFRHYFTANHSFMGFYFLMGLDLGVMSWSYTNAIEVPAEDGGTEFISDDDILMLSPSIGLGMSLIQTKVVHFGVSMSTGVRLHLGKTFQEFENDLFKDVGEFQLNLEASIFF